MPLAFVELHAPEPAAQRGIARAEDFLRHSGVELDVIYREVLADAEGEPHNAELVELWDKAQDLAIEEALQGQPPLSVPCLIFAS